MLQLRFSSCATHWAPVNYACAFVVDDDFFYEWVAYYSFIRVQEVYTINVQI